MDLRFQLKADWPISPQQGEKDVAHLSIWHGETALTQLADLETNENRTYFKASAVSLGLWIADNWWRLRHEPIHDGKLPSPDWRMCHELSSISGGTLWPPIMMYGTGSRVMIAPAYGANLSKGPVRYLDLDLVHSVDGQAFDAGIDSFLTSVARHCASGLDGDALNELVTRLREERADEDVAAWRKLEAQLGFDPDGAPDALMARLSELEATLGERAVEEAAIASPGLGAGETLQAAIDAATASKLEVDLSIARTVDANMLSDKAPPWRLGEDAAVKVRQALDIKSGPLDEAALTKLAGRPWGQVLDARPSANALPYAARLGIAGGDAKLALQTSNPIDRPFEVARIVADEIWAPAERFGVVSRARTERQKFQRAFAHGLLLPFGELSEIVDFEAPTDAQIDKAASIYGVRPAVVNSALVVRGVLPRESLAYRLEAA